MDINFYLLFFTALIPLIIGSVWYSNLLFGKTWFKVSGMTEDKMKSGNMLIIFGLTYILGLMLSAAMMSWCVHQFATQSLFATQEGFADQTGQYYEYFQNFMSQFGGLHRSFGHGAVHGGFAAMFIVLPIIAINSLFERKGWKYILVHLGYWLVTLILIGGFISQYL